MKKLAKVFVLMLALSISLGSFIGCTPSPAVPDNNITTEGGTGTTLTKGTTLETIVTQINEEIGIQMPGDVDETTLSDLFHISSDMVDTFYGKFAMTMTSSDNVVAVKAAPGKIEDVVSALEQRKAEVIQSFEMYLPDQYEKAQAGQVIVRGDYAFLIIIGDYEKGFDNEMAKAEEIIDSYFEQNIPIRDNNRVGHSKPTLICFIKEVP